MNVLKAYDVCNIMHNYSCLQYTADVKVESGSKSSSNYSAYVLKLEVGSKTVLIRENFN